MGKIYDKVMKEYKEEDVELSGMFFQFSMPGLTYKEILDDYKELQKDINGDNIVFLTDLKTQEQEDDDYETIVIAIEQDYESCSSLLKGCVSSDSETIDDILKFIASIIRVYRIMDIDSNEFNITGGTILNFVF